MACLIMSLHSSTRQLYTTEHISVIILFISRCTKGPVKRKRGRPKGSTKKKHTDLTKGTTDSKHCAEHNLKEKTTNTTNQEEEQPHHFNKGSTAAINEQTNIFSFDDFFFSKQINLDDVHRFTVGYTLCLFIWWKMLEVKKLIKLILEFLVCLLLNLPKHLTKSL